MTTNQILNKYKPEIIELRKNGMSGEGLSIYFAKNYNIEYSKTAFHKYCRAYGIKRGKNENSTL